jgi:hypothetical protein
MISFALFPMGSTVNRGPSKSLNFVRHFEKCRKKIDFRLSLFLFSASLHLGGCKSRGDSLPSVALSVQNPY